MLPLLKEVKVKALPKFSDTLIVCPSSSYTDGSVNFTEFPALISIFIGDWMKKGAVLGLTDIT